VVWYLDTSAFLKLVVAEEESSSIRAWMARSGPCWSSQLLRTEALRAGHRLGIAEEVVAEALSTFLAAGRLRPSSLRSLDALHLATALELGDDLQGVVTYDARMIEGAEAASIAVITPA
jgi:predicted nucleic acid-binding protein